MVSQVKFRAGPEKEVQVPLGIETPHQGRTDQAPVAGDEDLGFVRREV
jgi:hypothetical protein